MRRFCKTCVDRCSPMSIHSTTMTQGPESNPSSNQPQPQDTRSPSDLADRSDQIVPPASNSSSSSPATADQYGEPSSLILGFSGPLPTPAMLEEFDRVLPGLARRIVDRADTELAHRHAIELKALDAQIKDQHDANAERRRGQIFAFVLCFFFLASGIGLTLIGHPKVGGTIATATLVSVVGVFVAGRRTKNEPAKAVEGDKGDD